MPTNDTIDPATSSTPINATQILTELNESKKQIQQLRDTVVEQQRALVKLSTAGQPARPTEPQGHPQKFTNPKEFFDYVSTVVADQVNGIVETRLDAMLGQLTPLLREATKDAPVWGKTEMARKIADENPGITMELALELAETRMAKQATADKARQAEAEKIALQERADAASVGTRETSSGNLNPRGQRGSRQVMEDLWNKLDMDSKLQEFQAQDDVWGAPAVSGVKILTAIDK